MLTVTVPKVNTPVPMKSVTAPPFMEILVATLDNVKSPEVVNAPVTTVAPVTLKLPDPVVTVIPPVPADAVNCIAVAAA